MSCTLTETTLVAGVDYEVDLVNGRILFKSTGLLGPDLATLLAGGGCGAQVDFCGTTPLHIPCASKIASCLPCNDDPVANISAEDEDTDRFLFNFNTRQRPRLGFTFENVGCKRKCTSEVSQFEADLCAILQVTECINDGFRDETGPTIGTVPPFQVPQPPGLFFNSAQTCTTFCADGTSFGFTLAAGMVAADNQAQANRIAFSLACRRSSQLRVCIRTTSLPMACIDTSYSKQLLGSGGTPFRVTFDNFSALSALCAPATSFPNSVFPYVWSATGLPSGLSLEPCSGMITGTPTQSGSFSVTLRAQDSIGSFQTKTLTLVVLGIDNNSTLAAFKGEAYSETLTVTPTGTYIFSLVAGNPPAWLSLDSATGVLSGTPDENGDFMFTVQIESTDGSLCTKEFELSVTNRALLAYWDFEDAPPDFDDKTGHGNTLLFNGGGGALPPIAVTGIIGNGAQLFDNSGAPLNPTVLECSLAAISFNPNGWTAAGWMNCAFTAGGNTSNVGLLEASGNGGLSTLQMAMSTTSSAPVNRIRLSVTTTGPVVADAVDVIGLSDGWNFWVMAWDATTGKFTLQVNNGTVAEVPSTWLPGVPIGDVGVFRMTGFFSAVVHLKTVDETGVWARTLDVDERAALWNGGLATTYPNVP